VQSAPGSGATFWIELPDSQAGVGGAQASASA